MAQDFQKASCCVIRCSPPQVVQTPDTNHERDWAIPANHEDWAIPVGHQHSGSSSALVTWKNLCTSLDLGTCSVWLLHFKPAVSLSLINTRCLSLDQPENANIWETEDFTICNETPYLCLLTWETPGTETFCPKDLSKQKNWSLVFY